MYLVKIFVNFYVLFLMQVCLSTCYLVNLNAAVKDTELESEAIAQFDSFYDPTVDYALFLGRITDKDTTGTVFKIETENSNIKFFRAGDPLEFTINNVVTGKSCKANVKTTEKNYFVIYVSNLTNCWDQDTSVRRGTQLNFNADRLKERIRESSLLRKTLLGQKKDFFKQLNSVNNFIWSYEQERVKVAAYYDEQIKAIEKQKSKSLELLQFKKRDQITIQRELQTRLDQIDLDLDFYRIEKYEQLKDRWAEDHHLGLPMMVTPQVIK